MGETRKRARFWGRQGGGARAIWRCSVAASASLALATSVVKSEDWVNFEGGKRAAALEEAFFETLGRCESPLLVERNEAEDALFGRFAEFEPIWQDRRFLTNGEVGAEARQRFELAEARYREKAFEECVGAFQTAFETFASENEEERARGEERKNDEQNGDKEEKGKKGEKERKEKKGGDSETGEDGKDGGIGEGGESGEVLRGRVRLRWEKPLRIVYLSPDWSAFERRDVGGKRWRPSGRFSTPELAPEFDATELTFETTWARAEETNEAATDKEIGENKGNAGNSENEATVVGVLEGVIGGDFRVWTLPLDQVSIENAEDREDEQGAQIRQNERSRQAREDERNREKRDAATKVGVDLPSVFQSGDAFATVGETTIKENGETTARVRFDFAEAFDAFDSHRVWCDKNDFALIIDDEAEKMYFVPPFGVEKEAGATRATAKGDETGLAGRRWAPIRLRVRERSANGALFELDFPDDAALREAVAQGRARLACRIPRFFFWTRFEVAGSEKRNDDGKFDDYNGGVEGNALKMENY